MAEEDLIIGKTEEGSEEATGEELECEDYNVHDEISSAYNALCAIDGIDEQLIPKEKQRMIRTIRRKSLEILHYNINFIHNDIFGGKEENDE